MKFASLSGSPGTGGLLRITRGCTWLGPREGTWRSWYWSHGVPLGGSSLFFGLLGLLLWNIVWVALCGLFLFLWLLQGGWGKVSIMKGAGGAGAANQRQTSAFSSTSLSFFFFFFGFSSSSDFLAFLGLSASPFSSAFSFLTFFSFFSFVTTSASVLHKTIEGHGNPAGGQKQRPWVLQLTCRHEAPIQA